MNKKCNECNEEKDLINFSKRNEHSYHNRCKKCTNLAAKKYREENKEFIKETQKKWYKTDGKIWKKNYETINKEIINEKNREKYKTDKTYRIKKILRNRFKTTVLNKKIYKSSLNYIGINLDYLLKWIESQFDDKMTWSNQGSYWNIDHVIPCSSFNLENEEEIKKCFNWKNLRPCEKIENFSKNNKIDENLITTHNNKVNEYISKHPVPN
jgi:hypothetical protein